jgi:hypothetical protein
LGEISRADHKGHDKVGHRPDLVGIRANGGAGTRVRNVTKRVHAKRLVGSLRSDDVEVLVAAR